MEGEVIQQWTFSQWVPRTAQEVGDTVRPELDSAPADVRGLDAENAALSEALAACRP